MFVNNDKFLVRFADALDDVQSTEDDCRDALPWEYRVADDMKARKRGRWQTCADQAGKCRWDAADPAR